MLFSSINPAPPVFEKELYDQVSQVGRSVSFEVVVDGEPAPTIKWMKDSKEVAPGDGITFRHSDKEWTMSISEVSKEDKGLYTAIAKNTVGEERTKALLYIQGWFRSLTQITFWLSRKNPCAKSI